MANKVKFGISNFHYAIATVAEDGSVTYGNWIAMPNIVSATPTDDSTESTDYADNVQVFDRENVSGVKVEFEFTDLAKEFLKNVCGFVENTAGGLMRPTDAAAKYVAVAFQIDGDSKNRIQVYFLGTVSSPNEGESATNGDSVTFAHSKFNFNAYPIVIGNYHFVSELVEEGTSGYSAFWSTTFATPTLSA